MESGIYKITNLINNKVYVGSAKNFSEREHRHFSDLQKGKHHQIKLQRAYDKYGKDNFIFEIIEKIPYEKDIIIEREQYFIDHYNQKESGYNIQDAQFGDILQNHPNRLEIIEKIRSSLKHTLSNMSQEERKKRFSMPGEKNPNYKGDSAKYKQKHECLNCKKLIDTHSTYCKECRKLPEFNTFFGKKHQEETINKMKNSDYFKNRPTPKNSITVIIDGIKYQSIGKAMEQTGLSRHNIKKILKNPGMTTNDIRTFKKSGIPYNLGKPGYKSIQYEVNGVIYKSKKELFEKLKIQQIQLDVLEKNGNAKRLSKSS